VPEIDRERETACNNIRYAWFTAGLNTVQLAGTVNEWELEAYKAGQKSMAPELLSNLQSLTPKQLRDLADNLEFMVDNVPAKWESKHWYAIPLAFGIIDVMAPKEVEVQGA
jgi:hypothetical protein